MAQFSRARAGHADGGGPDRQSGHRRGGGAHRPGRCAGAPGRSCTVAKPQRCRIGELFPYLRLQRQRIDQWRARGRQLRRLALGELPTRFLGTEPRRGAGSGGDRRGQPLRSRSGGADDDDERRQCLFPGAGLAGPDSYRAAQYRQCGASPQRHQGSLQSRNQHRPRRRAAGGRARQSTCVGAAAAANARSEHQRARDAGVAAAGGAACQRRLAQSDRYSTGHPRLAIGVVDPATGYQAPGGATCVRYSQCRQRARAILSEHSVDRAGRLSELGTVGAVPAARGVLQPGRQRDTADLRRRKNPRQFRIHQGEAGRTAADLPQDRGAVVRGCRQRADVDPPDHHQAAAAARGAGGLAAGV